MEIQWEVPKFKYGVNPAAVYRMDFDNGFFYIGSSAKAKTRWVLWKTIFKRDKFSSKVMADSVKGATKVTVTVLEMPPEDQLKDRETYYIRLFFAEKMNLNQSPNGHDNTGLKPIPEHLKRPKRITPKRPYVRGGKFKPPADHVWAFSKGVVQFDLQGNYIQSHKSIADAAKSVGVHDSTVKTQLNAKRPKGVKGYVFRFCGDNRPIVLLKRKVIQRPFIEIEGKPIIDLNTGVFYYSAKEAAAQTNFKLKQFYKMISGEILNKTQYRYA